MRPLTEEETTAVIEKLDKFIGENVTQLLKRPDGIYVFRYHKDRVFYCNKKVLNISIHVPRKLNKSSGVCFGKFTKSKKFRLGITALDYLARYAMHKVWVKPSQETQFLFGENVLKSGLARLSEGIPQYHGVVVFSLSDVPLGFGLMAKSTSDCRRADPLTAVVYNQADVGEYIRDEDHIL